ncbi:MAG: uroporphyrinogen-III synthase [Nannocystaceae bacterium]
MPSTFVSVIPPPGRCCSTDALARLAAADRIIAGPQHCAALAHARTRIALPEPIDPASAAAGDALRTAGQLIWIQGFTDPHGLTRDLARAIALGACYELFPPIRPLAVPMSTRSLRQQRIRVILTRALDRTGAFSVALAGRGARVLAWPCLKVVAPDDERVVLDTLRGRHQYDGIIVSSPTGANVLARRLIELGTDLSSLSMTLAAIGPRTAARCETEGRRPDIVASDPRSEGLAAELARVGRLGRRWLHLRADEGRGLLSAAFEMGGGRLDVIVGYRTIRPALAPSLFHALLEPHDPPRTDILVFGSGKAGRHCVENLRNWAPQADAMAFWSRTRVVTIGPATTAAVERLGLDVSVTAHMPSDEALAEAIFAAEGATGPAPTT